MRDSFGKAILELSQKDEKVYVIDGDLANSTRIDSVFKENPNKFIECGIAEQNMVGIAAGMATVGLQPWVVTFTSFLTKRALDQITVSIAQPNLDVKLIGAYSGLLNGRVGKTHQGIEDIAIMRAVPNMTVLSPGDGIELIQMIEYANKYNGPIYIRLSRESKDIFTQSYKFKPYIAQKLYLGEDMALISTGNHTYYAEEALNLLKEDGIKCSLLHVPMIKPIDKRTIIEISRYVKYGIITVEDHSIIGGLGSSITEILSEHNPTKIIRVGIRDKNIESGSDEDLLKKYNLSTKDIYNAAKYLISETNN